MTLRRWLAIVVGTAVFFAILAAVARPLHVDVDPRLAFIVFGLFVVWSFFTVNIRWTANRYAVAAGVVYIVVTGLMLFTPIDGDEPYYLLITESIVHDRDLDLRNQYRDLAHSATGRTDLVPQIGDTNGRSHLEPFLPLILVPGYLAGKLRGALIVIALFGALLARSTVRLFEDEGIDDATIRLLFPLIALGPPIIFYAARIWPEVPAAFCFVEAIRGVRQRRPMRWIPALGGFVLLKFRFLLVAIVLLARALRGRRQMAIAAVFVAVATAAGLAITPHTWHEIIPGSPMAMLTGFFGLLLDGATGILFQAPVYAFGVLAAARWRSMPAAFRLGVSSSLLYILYLVPRPEWHGGWSPPLRYIVFLMPVLALGAAAIWKEIAAAPVYAAIAWTFAVAAHGLAYPWRLFHMANGENVPGEMLSEIWRSDFSRLFPSYIRPNMAALVAAVVAGIVLFLVVVEDRRSRLSGQAGLPVLHFMLPAVFAALVAIAFAFGRRPADRIEFEDAHVIHRGGELYPYEFQVARYLFRGGWILRQGDSLSFLAHRGPSILQYSAASPALIQLGGSAYSLPASRGYAKVRVALRRDGRAELRCLHGVVNLDRMDHE